MATLIATADGNLTGSTTFAAAETGTGALNLVRNSFTTLGVATSVTSATFTVTNAKVIDSVLLFVKQQAPGSTGTFKVDLQKGGVSQASVTVNKTDLPDLNSAAGGAPVLFKLTGTATGDGGSNWTIVMTTTGTQNITYSIHAAGVSNFTRALRTTTTATPAAADDLYIVGELTGAGTKNTRTVTMDSTAATVYGNGAVNSTTVNGGGIHISSWGTLTYGTTPGTNYILRVAGDVIVYQYGALNIVSPQTSTTQVLEFQPVSADGDFGLRCLDNSTVTITGQPRTAGKLVTQCKLTADVASNNVLVGGPSASNGSYFTGALDASDNSLLIGYFQDNTTSAPHGVSILGTSVTNTTQTAMVWLARGGGLNNRYVRFTVGNNSPQSSVTAGFYSDIDLQAGTAGTVTAIGTGTATSVSITPVGRGYLVKMTGKVSSTSATSNLLLNSCAVAGTPSYIGNTTTCFHFQSAVLVTATSISDTVFNVNTDTGWLAGDAVCVASTSRTASECEIYPLNANAGASSLTTAVSSGAVPVRSGTAPTQAEIGLITRNVKIRSTSTTLMSYVYCTALSTVTVSWAEFYYVGHTLANKRGIEIDGGAVANPKSFTYCSIHDIDNWGLYCNSISVVSLNLTFSNNVIWNQFSQTTINLMGPITNTDWTFSSNLVMRIAVQGFSLADIGGVCSGNTVVGSSTSNAFIMAETGAATLGTFDGNTVHSCSLGLNVSVGFSGTVSNFTAWRNNSSGVYLGGGTTGELTFVNLTLFGNSAGTTGQFNSSGDAVNIRGGVIAGDTGFPVNYGFAIPTSASAQFNLSSVDMSGVGTGLAPHVIGDFLLNGGAAISNIQGVANNCKFGAPALLSSKSFWASGAAIGFQKYNQTAGDHRTELTYGQWKTDSVVYHSASTSMRMTPSSASNKLESALKGNGMLVAVPSGATVTASVWVRKDATYLTGNQPRLIVRANASIGIDGDTVLATDATAKVTGTALWNRSDFNSMSFSNGDLTVTTTAVSNSGVRAISGFTTGKYYFEFTATAWSASEVIGLGRANAAFQSSLAGVAGIGKDGNMWINGTGSGSVGGRSNGDIIGIAVDLTANLAWFRVAPSGNWNNSGTANPATGVGGKDISVVKSAALYPMIWGGSSAAVSDTFTANFGATAFSGAVPSGFTAGWSAQVYAGTWVQLSGTTTAATDDGVMEFIVDCDGATGFINVDDWSATLAMP